MKTPASVKRPKVTAKSKPKSQAQLTETSVVRIFVSYSHKDAGAQEKLQTHLVPLTRDGVSTWYDGDMDAGEALDANIAKELRSAHIFVALLSPDYLASRYCWEIEYRRADNRRKRGTMRIVGVIVRPCGWKRTQAAGFKLLPTDGKSVTDWRSGDHAYLDVAEGIAGMVKTLRKEWSASIKPSRKAARPAKTLPSSKSPIGKVKPVKQTSIKAKSPRKTPQTGKPRNEP